MRCSRQAYRKCVTFLAVLFFSLVVVKSAQAMPLPLGAEDEKTILVRATVPVSLEFRYVIGKNSTLASEKYAFSTDEEIPVVVTIRGGNSEFQRLHRVTLLVTDAHHGEKKISGVTDVHGEIVFSFPAEEDMVGDVTVEALDATYVPAVRLSRKLYLAVYRAEDGKKQPKQAIKSDMGGSQFGTLEINLPSEIQTDQGADIFQKSDTIRMLGPDHFSFSRAGPASIYF
jgi:hypothetical protein